MKTYMTAAAIGLLLSVGVPSRTVTATTHLQARIVHFPVDRSLGRLLVRDADAGEPDDARFVESDAEDYLGPAQGDVASARRQIFSGLAGTERRRFRRSLDV